MIEILLLSFILAICLSFGLLVEKGDDDFDMMPPSKSEDLRILIEECEI